MALLFSAASHQYLSVPNSLMTSVGGSMACWVNPTTEVVQQFITAGSTISSNYLTLGANANATISAATSQQGSGNSVAASVATMNTSAWNHVAVVFTSTTAMTVWVNGVSAAFTVTARTPGVTNITQIGAFINAGTITNYANASIAYPCIWTSYLLTSGNIASLYNSGIGANPQSIQPGNIVSFLGMQSGSPYFDQISNGFWTNNGTPTVVADPFSLSVFSSTSTFPVSIDIFKTIPTPTLTPTNLSDTNDDTLSTRLQKHSDAIVATETYIFSHKSTPINILDYGADPTGVLDSTTPIQNAINSLPAAGGSLYFPTGAYTISNTITLNKPGVYRGDGAYATTISTTSATLDMFNITSSGVKLSDIRFISSVTRTSGFCINTLSSGLADILISNFLMQGAFEGINVYFSGTIRDGEILSTVTNGIGIQINFVAGAFTLIEHVTVGGTSNVTYGLYGILVQGTPELTVSHCYVFYMMYGMYFNGTTNPINVVSVHHSAFDQVAYGIQFLSTASTGQIWEVFIDSVHIATAINHGIALAVSGSGVIDGIGISNCVILNNGANGINLMAATNVRVENCGISGNTAHGISIASGVGHFQIVGNRIGPGYTLGGNGAFAIALAGVGLNSNFIVADNDLSGNTGGEIAGTGTGTFVIANNI